MTKLKEYMLNQMDYLMDILNNYMDEEIGKYLTEQGISPEQITWKDGYTTQQLFDHYNGIFDFLASHLEVVNDSPDLESIMFQCEFIKDVMGVLLEAGIEHLDM